MGKKAINQSDKKELRVSGKSIFSRLRVQIKIITSQLRLKSEIGIFSTKLCDIYYKLNKCIYIITNVYILLY